MNRIDRLVATLLLLQTRRKLRASDIAEHFHVSVRTVYRDLQSLEEAGVPLVSEIGGGYYLVEGYHVAPIVFSFEEANALFIGERLAIHMTDQSIVPHIQSALLKIRSALPHKTQSALQAIQETTVFSSRQKELNERRLLEIQQAIVAKKVLFLEYYAQYQGRLSEREVEPLGVMHYGNHWHLIAHCRLREDLRDFRIDRIKNFKLLETTFQADPSFSFSEYLKRVKHQNSKETIEIKAPNKIANQIKNQYHYAIEQEKIQGEYSVLVLSVPSFDWATPWLLSYGKHVEVLRPESLRKHIKETAQNILQLYQNSN